MTDITNVLDPAYLGEASTFAASGDTIPADETPPQFNTAIKWWDPHDAYKASRGWPAKRMFRTDDMVLGQIPVSHYIDLPAGNLAGNDHALWDVGSVNAGSNVAHGGYGTQLTTARNYEFLWRNAGSAAPPVVLASIDLDELAAGNGHIYYPPNQLKNGTIWKLGACLNFLPHGFFVDMWVDGNIIETVSIPNGEAVTINEGAGLTLFATSRDPADAAALTNVFGTGLTIGDLKFSSFSCQRFENLDNTDKVPQIMSDAMFTRQARPARGVGL